MKALFCTALALVASAAFADAGKSNWALRFGLVVPRVDGISTDTGAAFGVSFRAIQKGTTALEIESLGVSYRAEEQGDTATFRVSNLNAVAYTTPDGSPVYVGGLLGITEASAEVQGFTVTGDRKLVSGVVVGKKFSKQWFGEVRYTWSDVPASRGTFFLAGYRF